VTVPFNVALLVVRLLAACVVTDGATTPAEVVPVPVEPKLVVTPSPFFACTVKL